jgi:small subunit ribosomal protein S3
MGQKTHPIGYRLGYNYTWSSRWYAGKDYAKLLHQDVKIRKMVKARLYHAGVSKVEIERSGDQTRVIIHTARPGIIIGRKGAEVDKLKADLEKQYGGQVYITVKEIKKPELDAQLVSENVATQLEKRVAFRRAMKRSVQSALRLGAQGIKIMVAGRLGGAEIARTEWYREGRVPLHTLRAEIDYGFADRNRLWVCRSAHDNGADRSEDLDLQGRTSSYSAYQSRIIFRSTVWVRRSSCVSA